MISETGVGVSSEPGAGDTVGAAIGDVGVGTGYYLAGVLDALPTAIGIGIDASKAAARRAARAHPRAGVIVADVWRELPIGDHKLSVVTSIFSPRNPAEFRRVLADDGLLVIVTPTDAHLTELVRRLSLLRVDRDKARRLADAMYGHFQLVDSRPVEMRVSMDHRTIDALVRMGPSARHISPDDLRSAIDGLPESMTVTVSVLVSRWRPVA